MNKNKIKKNKTILRAIEKKKVIRFLNIPVIMNYHSSTTSYDESYNEIISMQKITLKIY